MPPPPPHSSPLTSASPPLRAPHLLPPDRPAPSSAGFVAPPYRTVAYPGHPRPPLGRPCPRPSVAGHMHGQPRYPSWPPLLFALTFSVLGLVFRVSCPPPNPRATFVGPGPRGPLPQAAPRCVKGFPRPLLCSPPVTTVTFSHQRMARPRSSSSGRRPRTLPPQVAAERGAASPAHSISQLRGRFQALETLPRCVWPRPPSPPSSSDTMEGANANSPSSAAPTAPTSAKLHVYLPWPHLGLQVMSPWLPHHRPSLALLVHLS